MRKTVPIRHRFAAGIALVLTAAGGLLAGAEIIYDPGSELPADPPPGKEATSLDPPAASGLAASAAAAAAPLPADPASSPGVPQELQARLELARHYRQIGDPRNAEPLLIELLNKSASEPVQQAALLELAMAARDQGDLPRAQQVYAQFLSRWSGALQVPEILLRQGQLFRQMGLNNLALAKFYGVMTSALVLKNDTLEYYKRLVLEAQTEIADTHYQLGRYVDAADCFSRLLKQNNPALDRASVQTRLVRALSALGRDEETVSQGQDLLLHFPRSPAKAEVRFRLALALKQQNRNQEALQQVLLLLREEKASTAKEPDRWAYWQQRAGNVIGNQLYREGDYVRALEVYTCLAGLDTRPAWQLPVKYQIALTYERLEQPRKALDCYRDILKQESGAAASASPTLKALLEMARWRADFVSWHSKAESRASKSGG